MIFYTENQVAAVKAAMTKIEDIILDAAAQDENLGTAILNVMSALRGPDSEGANEKWLGTNHVRHAAFPRISTDDPFTTPWDLSRDYPPSAHVSKNHHFNTHVQLAFNALGIKEE